MTKQKSINPNITQQTRHSQTSDPAPVSQCR